jgi:exosortase/archaeosortase family protein
VRNLWGIWLLLWLLVPLPLGVDSLVIIKLQNLSSRISSAILDMWGVHHLMSGNVLQLPDKQFFVDEACSGIVSVMSVIACGLIWAVWWNRSLLHVVLLLLAGVGWAISLNVARICIIAFAHAWWLVDLSSGWWHEALGLGLFCLTFLALISSDVILEFILAPIMVAGQQTETTYRNGLIRTWNALTRFADPKRDIQPSNDVAKLDAADASQPYAPEVGNRLGIAGGGAFFALGLISILPIAVSARSGMATFDRAQAIEQTFLPAQLGSWTLEKFESVHRPGQSELGDYSKSFTYRDPSTNRNYSISLDFPFSGGWHELCVCYKNTGWDLVNRHVNRPTANPDWPIIEGTFTRATQEHGYLAFSNFNRNAMGLAPPSELIFWQPWRRLRRRLLQTISEEVYQVQVWTEGNHAVPQDEQDRVQAILLDVRERFRKHFE